MQTSVADTSSRHVMGGTTAALVMTCLGALWGVQGQQIMYFITPVVTVGLLVLWFLTRQLVWRLPQEAETPAEHTRNRQVSRRFGMVVGGESGAIIAAIVLLRFINHPVAIAPTICLIVGLHFLPLAALFQHRMYVLVSVVLSLLGGGALLASLIGVKSEPPSFWSVVVGMGASAVLWLASLSILMRVRRVLHLNLAAGLM